MVFSCAHCDRSFPEARPFSIHLTNSHGVTADKKQEYYRNYMMKVGEGTCSCGKSTRWLGMSGGYDSKCHDCKNEAADVIRSQAAKEMWSDPEYKKSMTEKVIESNKARALPRPEPQPYTSRQEKIKSGQILPFHDREEFLIRDHLESLGFRWKYLYVLPQHLEERAGQTRYCLDFLHGKYKVNVEIDGDWHESRALRDQKRDSILNDLGINVIRINKAAVHKPSFLAELSAEIYCRSIEPSENFYVD